MAALKLLDRHLQRQAVQGLGGQNEWWIWASFFPIHVEIVSWIVSPQIHVHSESYLEIGSLYMLLVQRRSYWIRVVPNPIIGVPIRSDTDTGGQMQRGIRKTQRTPCHKPKNTKNCQALPEAGREVLPLGPKEGTNPADTWILDFWPPNCERVNFHCFSHLVCGHLLRWPRKLTHQEAKSAQLSTESLEPSVQRPAALFIAGSWAGNGEARHLHVDIARGPVLPLLLY